MAKNVLCVPADPICSQPAFLEGGGPRDGSDRSGIEGGRKGARPQTRRGWWSQLPSDAYCANGRGKVFTGTQQTKVSMKRKT
jgi:hypothetical protein